MNEQNVENSNLRIRLKQLALLGSGVGIAVIVMSLLDGMTRSSAPSVGSLTQEQTEYSRIDGIDPEIVWTEESARDITNNSNRITELEKHIKLSEQQKTALQTRLDELQEQLSQQERDAKEVIDAQAAMLTDQQSDPFASIQNPIVPSSTNNLLASNTNQSGAAVPATDSLTNSLADPLTSPLQPSLIRFDLTPKVANPTQETGGLEDIKDTKYYLPAGAHVPAIITTGAAASVSVTGQADPRPVLMRLTGKAHTAANSKGDPLKADIRGCTIIGEARGDLSSERVYVRLQTMTCRRDAGVVETPVQGFVAGTGQAGVRGQVITREGDLVEKSALAGVLSGFGGAAAQGLRPPTVISAGTVQRPTDGQVLEDAGKTGLAQGIGNAGDRLAQYYISRAEQYQPVVSLKGGTAVEVIFIQGTYLDGRGLDGRTTSSQTAGVAR